MTLIDLWLPILLSAVFVFVASSVIHMCLPIHRGDFKKLPSEDSVLASMRAASVAPGAYMLPCADSMKDMCSPEIVEKQKLGPVGYLTVVPNGPMNMGKNLLQWFLFSVLIGVFVGYIATIGLSAASSGTDVFRMTATVAFLGYGVSNISDSIWKGVSWTITAKFLFDGLVYGLATGGAFLWMWPAATA